MPERITVRSDTLGHHYFGTGIAECGRPLGGVVVEERLQGARDEVYARERTRHDARRLVGAARRGAEDRAVDVWMPKSDGESQLPARRDTEHRRAFGRQPDSETRSHPSAHVFNEELLVCREPLRLKAR